MNLKKIILYFLLSFLFISCDFEFSTYDKYKVSGLVLDNDTGEPLSGITVTAIGKIYGTEEKYTKSTLTNDEGHYDLILRDKYNYYFFAERKNSKKGEDYLRKYNDNKSDIKNITTITLKKDIEQLNFKLEKK